MIRTSKSEKTLEKDSNHPTVHTVLVKFNYKIGPEIFSNNSSLDEFLLVNLAIRGISSMMSGLEYSEKNTRCFRGLFQLDYNNFAYCFDLLLSNRDNRDVTYTPILVFLVFANAFLPAIGRKIRKIEHLLKYHTKEITDISHLNHEFGVKINSIIQNSICTDKSNHYDCTSYLNNFVVLV